MAKMVKISNITRANINTAIDRAIAELFEAKLYLNRNNFERTEDEIGDAVSILGRVIRKINRLE